MDEALRQYTAFTVGNLGFFECECMLFGLCNAPAMFQRLMQSSLGELNLSYCLFYLDDMIVFSKTEEEHLQHLHIVFDCFREHNLKLKPTKCKFFWSEINYLAHHVSKESTVQQGESESHGWICSTPNLHRNQGFLRLSGTLPMFHQRIWEDSTTIALTSFLRGCLCNT